MGNLFYLPSQYMPSLDSLAYKLLVVLSDGQLDRARRGIHHRTDLPDAAREASRRVGVLIDSHLSADLEADDVALGQEDPGDERVEVGHLEHLVPGPDVLTGLGHPLADLTAEG